MLLWCSNLHMFWATTVATDFIWSKDWQCCWVLGLRCSPLLSSQNLCGSSGYPFTWVGVRRFNVGSVTSVSPTLHLSPYPKCLFNVVWLFTWFSVERGTSKETNGGFRRSTCPWFSDQKCLPTVNYNWFLLSSELWGANWHLFLGNVYISC